MPPLPFDRSVRLPSHVMAKEIDGETVLLHLDSATYFGLDAIGTRMLALATTCATLEEAVRGLTEEFDVDAGILRRDLDTLVSQLLDQGLVEWR